VRQPKLRWPIPAELSKLLLGQTVNKVARRAKYLLLELPSGTLMIHLGMSGSLRIVPKSTSAGTHDHADFQFSNGNLLRYTDPRRFGTILWLEGDPNEHPLLKNLGPEPLSEDFTGKYLHILAGQRKVPVKSFIMDGHVVVGVGNIYANEALFRAGIHPKRTTARISLLRYELLAQQIKETLAQAIISGGTTLKDFVGGDGKPGYFKQSLQVYGRGGQPCVQCGNELKEIRLGQRSTVFCSRCQR
jgi:formamidopyrimidine-DNA glycosylase